METVIHVEDIWVKHYTTKKGVPYAIITLGAEAYFVRNPHVAKEPVQGRTNAYHFSGDIKLDPVKGRAFLIV